MLWRKKVSVDMKNAAVMIGLTGLMALGGCAGQATTSNPRPTNYSTPPPPYRPDYRYGPNPAVVDIFSAASPQTAPPLTAFVSPMGIRQAEPNSQIPPSVEVRIRFDNHGTEPVRFDPATLELETGELRPLPSPILNPATPFDIPPGQSRGAAAYFPFPPGTNAKTLDLNHFRVRWRVQIAQQPVTQTAYFDRIP
jgi:hypothetical protein